MTYMYLRRGNAVYIKPNNTQRIQEIGVKLGRHKLQYSSIKNFSPQCATERICCSHSLALQNSVHFFLRILALKLLQLLSSWHTVVKDA